MNKRTIAVLALGLLAVMAPQLEAQQTYTLRASSADRRAWLGFSFERTEVQRPGEIVSTLTVADVVKDSPAEKAGLRKEDTLVSINGLNASEQLIASLGSTLAPGDTVVFRVRREGRMQDVRIIAAKPPANMLRSGNYIQIRPDSINRLMRVFVDSARFGMDTAFWRVLPGGDSAMIRLMTRNDSMVRLWGDSARSRAFIRAFPRDTVDFHFRADSLFFARPNVNFEIMRGLRGEGPDFVVRSWGIGLRALAGAELEDLNPELARYFEVNEGVLITNVPEGTPAREAGLRSGDVITRAGGTGIANVAELRRALAGAKESTIPIEVVRAGEKRTLQLRK